MENFTKGSLTQKQSGMWRKLGSVLLGLALVFAFANTSTAQVFHSEDFQGATSWAVGGFASTSTNPCESTLSRRENMYSFVSTALLTSPLLGTSNGLQVTMDFQYKVINWSGGGATPATFGTVFVQYGATATGPWTTAYTINSGNHTPATTCASPSFTFTPPAGNLFVRFDCVWNSGDYYLYFDDININQATPTCSGAPATPTVAISSVGGCNGGGLTLTATGLDVGTGLSSQWEYSSDATFAVDVNDLVGETSATANITAPATTVYYRVRSECNDVPSISYSNIVSYAGVSCASVVVPFSGSATNDCGVNAVVTDHAGASANYNANADGYLVLQNTPGSFITLTGTHTIEAGQWDDLNIYDGVGTTGTLIDNYDGAGTINTINGTDGQILTIEFTSDAGVQDAGFSLTALYSGTCAVCTGAPAAGTVAISDAEGCAVASVALTASGLDNVNIDYQWQVSNDNFVADINNIAGATGASANVTTPAGAGVTYYRVRSFCSDSGLESFSPSVTYTSILCGAQALPGTTGGSNTVVCGTNTWLYDSPGGGSDYNSNSDSYTVLDASGTAVIALNGNYDTEGCCDDIFIYYGVGTAGAQVPGSPFAGSGSVNITGNVGEALTVRLESDGSIQGAGLAFQVLYSGVCASCSAPPANGTVSIPSTEGCSGGTMTLATSGLDVTVDNTYQWQVSNDDFVTDINDIAGETGLTYDLTTTTGLNYYRIQSFCSSDLAAPAYSSSVSFEGFACTPFSLPTSGSNSVVCGVNTNLTDDGGLGSDYSNGADGYTVLEASNTAQITLTGTYDIEATWDNLYIYNGVGTGGTQVAGSPFDGTGTINVTSAAGQALTVRLDTDGTGTEAGLDLTAIYSGTCATCPAFPTNTAATSVVSNDATLNWLAAAVGAADGYEWEVRADDASLPGTGSEIATGTVGTGILTVDVPGTPFSANTTYRVFVRSVCTTGSDFSDWNSSIDFTTPCTPEAAPTAVETFTTYTGNAPDPLCWTESTAAIPTTPTAIATGNGTWRNTSGYANTGSNPGVKANLYGTATYWLISQPIDLGVTGGVYRVDYRMAATSYNGTVAQTSLGSHQVHLIVSTDGGATWDDDNIIQTHTGAFASGSGAVNIPAIYTGVVKFAIVAVEGGFSPDIDFHIDDFEVEVIPTCFQPTVTAASNITNSTADVNWTASSPEPGIGYEWEVIDGAALPGTGSETVAGTTVFGVYTDGATGLSGSTEYSVYARSNCDGSDYSPWNGPITFTTECNPVTAPTVNEAFGVYTNGSSAPIACWKEANGAIGTPSVIAVQNADWGATSGFGNAGSNPGIKDNLYGADAGGWVISPGIDLGVTAGVYRVSYRMSVTPYNSSATATTMGSHQMHVILSLDGGITWNAADILATYTGAGSYAATTYTHNLSTQTGVIKVAFVNVEGGTSPDIDIHLDDFIVEVIPPCATPTLAPTTNITDVTATVNWVEPGTLPTVGYEWEVRDDAALPGTVGQVDAGAETVGTTFGSATGLTANTTYSWYVRSECTAGTQFSAWTTAGTFTTACTPETAPTVPETFDSYSGAAPDPDCWTEGTGVIGTPSALAGSSSGWTVSTSFVNVASDASARINLYGGTNEWLISQPIDLGVTPGDYRVSFDMGARTYFGTTVPTDIGTHEVSVIVSADAGATWNAADVIATYTGAGIYDGSTVTIDLTAYSGVIKVAFVTNTFNSSPDLWFYIDDVFVEEIPTCFEPTALTAAGITIDGVDVSWTAPTLGTVTGYEYEVSTSATPPVSGTSVAGTSVAGITGLTSGTLHYLHVRTACVAVGDFSQWETTTFYTLYENPFCNVGGVPIPDNGCGSSTFLEQSVLVSGVIGLLGTDVVVNKCVINIAHTYDSDLTISLISPLGTEVMLSDGNGSSGDNYGGALCNESPTVFSMIASSAITSGSAPFSGSYIPEGDFSAFDGEDPNGFWTLKICDAYNGDEGELNYFRLQIIPPPTCFAPTGLVSSGITATTATVNWTAGTGGPGPSSYQFYYNTTGIAPDEFTTPTGTATGSSVYMNTLVPGTTYYFWVRSDCGIQSSEWSAQEEFTTAVENDLCEDAIAVVCGGTYNGDNTNATQQTIPGAPGTPGRGLWYVFTGNGGDVTFSLCNSAFFDSRINVLTGTCGSLTNVANNDDECSLMSEVTVSTVSGTEYYIYASNYSAATSGAPFVLDVSCGGFWTGNTGNDWSDAGNWSDNSVPGIGDNAVIPSAPSGGNFPTVLTGSESVNELVMQSGASLNILDGAALTTAGDVTNNGTINVANDASFVQQAGSGLSGSGIFNVTKNGSGVYDYWSSPVVNGALGGYFAFNSANSTIDTGDDENDPGWSQASGAIPVSRGGAFYGAGTRTFTGVAHNGSITAVTMTDNPAPADDWDLLGNPYPSGVSITGFLADNGHLQGGLSFWEDDHYATHDGIFANGFTSGANTTASNGVLGSCQGFMALTSGGGTIGWDNSMRVAENSSMLYRLEALQYLQISAFTSESSRQTTVAFMETSVDGLDGDDSQEIAPGAPLAFFSYIDAEEYAINRHGPLVADVEVPLGLNTNSATPISITLDLFSSLDDVDIILEDRAADIFTDLKEGDYTFSAMAQLYSNRFFLHVSSASVTGIEDALSEGMNAYVADEMLNVYSTNDVTGNLELLDMSGKVVMTHSNLNLGPNGIQLSLSGLSDGSYIVRVVGDDVNMSRKIVK